RSENPGDVSRTHEDDVNFLRADLTGFLLQERGAAVSVVLKKPCILIFHPSQAAQCFLEGHIPIARPLGIRGAEDADSRHLRRGLSPRATHCRSEYGSK